MTPLSFATVTSTGTSYFKKPFLTVDFGLSGPSFSLSLIHIVVDHQPWYAWLSKLRLAVQPDPFVVIDPHGLVRLSSSVVMAVCLQDLHDELDAGVAVVVIGHMLPQHVVLGLVLISS